MPCRLRITMSLMISIEEWEWTLMTCLMRYIYSLVCQCVTDIPPSYLCKNISYILCLEFWLFLLSADRHGYIMLQDLLALGERIGTVSTGLSDDALSKCLKRSLYVPTTSSSHEDGDIKCIICQVLSYIVTVHCLLLPLVHLYNCFYTRVLYS
jgi:hypothetical protein